MVIVGLITMNPDELIKWLYDHPEQVGIQVGFKDLTKIHDYMMNYVSLKIKIYLNFKFNITKISKIRDNTEVGLCQIQ